MQLHYITEHIAELWHIRLWGAHFETTHRLLWMLYLVRCPSDAAHNGKSCLRRHHHTLKLMVKTLCVLQWALASCIIIFHRVYSTIILCVQLFSFFGWFYWWSSIYFAIIMRIFIRTLSQKSWILFAFFWLMKLFSIARLLKVHVWFRSYEKVWILFFILGSREGPANIVRPHVAHTTHLKSSHAAPRLVNNDWVTV